jgi:hypothetical protein
MRGIPGYITRITPDRFSGIGPVGREIRLSSRMADRDS